ncbi:heavy-metal-associated domain-containing protein [Candidatus Woesearchaeota archaeon]|nr:heavy-metal-associated domain-containing protein [Candidatus Woesearchaeota archaeon]
MLVEDELEDMGATDVNVSLDEPTQTGTVIFNHSNPEQVITAIEDMNYEVSR